MIDVIDVSQYGVVEDDFAPLNDVTKLLNMVEVRSSNDELKDEADEWVCPVVEVLLLDDDIIRDDVDVL